MRAVDTSAWIEWIVDSSIGGRIRDEVPELRDLIVPTIVQLELAKWLAREAPQRKVDVIEVTSRCLVVLLDTPLSLHAAEVSNRYRLATADAIIYATALEHDADLLTCDAHFKDLPQVVYIPKVVA